MRRRSSFAARQSADSTAKEGSMSQRTWQSEHAAVVHGLAAATGRHAPGAEICKAGIAERVLIDIRQLAPALAARAAEMEANRRIPDDVVDVLKAIGAFRLFVPQSHGGLELDLPSGLRIVTALARVDGSVGWTVMIGSGGPLLAALLPRDTYDRVYRDGADAVIAAVTQPTGTAEPARDGWRVSGRWPFASGCLHADWMGGICVMTEDGKPLAGPDGKAPLLRGFLMPARDWQIEDTWHVAGLKATGSHHIACRDKIVPKANFFDLANGTTCLTGPLYQGVRQVLPLFHAAFALGLAQGALDELLALAGSGRRQLHAATSLRESEIFQHELGRLGADLRAAEAFQRSQTARHWQRALAGTLKDEGLLQEATQAGIWIVNTCLRVVDGCFALAGGAVVYETSPLQRRLRDMHTAAQHAMIQQRHYGAAGRRLLDAPAS
jgi:alkylation response protein AidB-like acyl-CoA dehydrogenase